MIRKETLTTFEKWKKPTKEEIEEMFKLCSDTSVALSKSLGITSACLTRWKNHGISYLDWALLSFLAGKGDIVRPEETEEELETKLENLAKVSFIYHKKLNDLQRLKELSRKISRKKKKEK